MDYKVRRHPGHRRRVAGMSGVCHASQGSKQPVSRKWVSLHAEIPTNEGLLLWVDDSGTPREQLSHHGLCILPDRATLLTWHGHDSLPGMSLTMGVGEETQVGTRLLSPPPPVTNTLRLFPGGPSSPSCGDREP